MSEQTKKDYVVPTGIVPRAEKQVQITELEVQSCLVDAPPNFIGMPTQNKQQWFSGTTSITPSQNVRKEKRPEHNHYYKNVEHLKMIDVYRVLELFEVSDPCIQHAIKKLLVAGGRGAGKSLDKDVKEAIDSLKRYQEMREEDYTHV